MELNVKEQTEKLQAEQLQLTNEQAVISHQVSLWQSRECAIKVLINKNQGALELLQSLSVEKPKDE